MLNNIDLNIQNKKYNDHYIEDNNQKTSFNEWPYSEYYSSNII